MEFTVDFFGVGPMRSGSTWLHEHLRRVPHVVLPREKESFFFDREFDRGVAWYRAQFAGRGGRVRGEVAPSYFDDPRAAERIKAWYPAARIVVTLRDPMARAWSHYLHLRRTRRVPAPLQEAIASDPRILNASRYSEHLARWRCLFPDEAIHVLPIAWIKRDPEGALRTVLRHLGLENGQPLDVSMSRSNAGYVPQAVWLERARRFVYHRLRRRHLFGVIDAVRPFSAATRNVPWLRSRPAPSPGAAERDLLLDALAAERRFYDELVLPTGRRPVT